MNQSKNFYKDITIGVFFIIGLLGFMSGEFIFSTALFGAASVLSNINFY
jgi:CheY-specific phosphatase CheX